MNACKWQKAVVFALFCISLSGCKDPNLDTVFYTVTNLGVNFDTRPPTAEIALSRREGVIQPEFAGGVHLPVIATMDSRPGLLDGRMTATFLGGAAAEIAARQEPEKNEDAVLKRGPGIVCVRVLPDGKDGLALPGDGATRPFIFGTSTNYGLFVGWDSLIAGLPDSVRLGYTRKELAIASVFAAGDCPANIQNHFPAGAAHAIAMPSFMATIDGGNRVGTPQNTAVSVRQSFATGSASRLLANNEDLQRALRNGFAAEARQTAAVAGQTAAVAVQTAAEAEKAAETARNEVEAARKEAAIQRAAAEAAISRANAAARANAPPR